MKLLAFGDIHANTPAIKHLASTIKKHQPDLLICHGDISIFENHLQTTLKKLALFKKQLLIIHGNHESEQQLSSACKRYPDITFLHKKIKTINNIVFIGYGGGGFSRTDPGFEQFIKKNEQKIKDKNIVLITHGPPYTTKLDTLNNEHVGCQSYTAFIRKHPTTVLALSGHIHENFGAQDTLGTTMLLNPGPYGKIIEL